MPKTVRFEDGFDASEAERTAVAKRLRKGKGKGKAVRAPVARRREASQQKGGSD